MDRFNDYHFHNNLAVLLKKFTGDEGERVDMQKLYGYIGLFTLVALWWLSKCHFYYTLVLWLDHGFL